MQTQHNIALLLNIKSFQITEEQKTFTVKNLHEIKHFLTKVAVMLLKPVDTTSYGDI